MSGPTLIGWFWVFTESTGQQPSVVAENLVMEHSMRSGDCSEDPIECVHLYKPLSNMESLLTLVTLLTRLEILPQGGDLSQRFVEHPFGCGLVNETAELKPATGEPMIHFTLAHVLAHFPCSQQR